MKKILGSTFKYHSFFVPPPFEHFLSNNCKKMLVYRIFTYRFFSIYMPLLNVFLKYLKL